VGEQLARTGVLPALVGGLLPIAGSLLAVIWFNYSSRVGISLATDRMAGIAKKFRTAPDKLQPRNLFVDITTGIRDLDIALNLIKYFLLSFGFLAAVFVIFTAFDLWRSAGAIDGGTALLGK